MSLICPLVLCVAARPYLTLEKVRRPAPPAPLSPGVVSPETPRHSRLDKHTMLKAQSFLSPKKVLAQLAE
jgi:hypothetical protein